MAYGNVYVYEEFETVEKAEAFVKNYYLNWPVMGYGTMVKVHEVGGTVYVAGQRYHSCD